MYNVYLVDDDEMLLDEITQTVPWQDNGFTVIGCNTNPEIAVEEILELQPDAVFSDLKMPKMDGLALVQTLKSKGLCSEYVMISAYNAFKDARAFFVMEGFDYILKPIQADDIQIVLERLGKKLLQKLGNTTATGSTAASSNFDEMVLYITRNYGKKHTLDKLGKQFGLSPNYICNLFAKKHNTTFGRFMTELRMNEAQRLMNTTNKALKAIAIDCGYTDYWHFFKVFKEFYGISPTHFRGGEQADIEEIEA